MTLTELVNAALSQLTADIQQNKLELPSAPDILIKARALLAKAECTSDQFSDLVKHDPNISARLIKVANSSLFGTRFHVTTVKTAVARLGLAKSQSLITGIVIAQNFMNARTRGLEPYFNQIWQQSYNVSAMAYTLAEAKTELDPEQALLIGMVHNIGKAPLILRLHQIPVLKDNIKLLTQVIKQILPRLYPMAGKLILDHWNFSAEISNIARTHADIKRESVGLLTLNDLITVSSELDKLSDYTDPSAFSDELVNSPMFQKLWSNAEEASVELDTLSPKIRQLSTSISH